MSRSAPSGPGAGDVASVGLFASRWSWIAGLAWLTLAPAALGAVVAGVWFVAVADGRVAMRVLALVGVLVASPALVVIAGVFADAGRRLVRPRCGRIDLLDDRLVIHDRWMLRRPLEILRSEIEHIERLPRLRFLEYSAFGGRRGRELGDSGPLLDWGTVPNCRLTLTEFRRFDEAIRTPPSRTLLQPISRGSLGRALLVRLDEPELGMARLDGWMATARHNRAVERLDGESESGDFGVVALWVAGFGGFAVFCLALAFR